MSVWVAAAVLCLGGAVARRERARDPSMPLREAILFASAITMVVTGMAATLLGLAGAFTPGILGWACAGLGVWIWPWHQRAPRASARVPRLAWVVPLALVAGTVAIRFPSNDYPLAGRDQGTYSLRARQLLRTGAVVEVDPVLASVDESTEVPAAADLWGLYPKVDEPTRDGRYEAAYRPGWYLADRARGRVVPQFLHLHAAVLAVGLAVGVSPADLVVALAGLGVLGLFCLGRRLWSWPFAALAAGLFALNPLAIWVGRTPLSETPTMLLVVTACVAIARAGPTLGDAQRAGPSADLLRAAFLLGSVAWIRGNGWLWAPVVCLVLWFAPPGRGRRGPALVYVAVVLGAVLVHAWSSFPYLYDELHRMIDWLGPFTPTRLVVGAVVGVIGWASIDELAFGRSTRPTEVVLRWGPVVLLGLTGVAVAAYVAARGIGAPTRPFSRLDPALPLVGIPMLVAAACGATAAARRVRLRGAAGVWTLAVVSIVVLTMLLYARRNLPQLGLYYYGRYLVAELLWVACLAAAYALVLVHRALARPGGRPRLAIGVVIALASGLLYADAGVLVRHPVSRMQEFAGTERLLQALAERTAPDAVVIAGGEGWHAGHTFNQVGGALQAGWGRSVVPFRTAEAAYASLHALLSPAGDAPTGGREVYLLVNEATHHMRRSDGSLVSAIDDALWPPFVATEVTLGELFFNRLTPVDDAVPIRVTRDELRMALLRVELDPRRRGEHRFPLSRPSARIAVRGGAGIVDGTRCLASNTPLRLNFDGLPSGPGALVLVAAPGTAGDNERWEVTVDGVTRGLTPPHGPGRARDTLGPLVLPEPPRHVELVGARARTDAPCRFGGLAEVRWLEAPPSPWPIAAQAVTFAPPHDLGHPVEPTGWVRGRGLGRFRPGTTGIAGMVGMAMRLQGGTPLAFAPEMLPADDELDVVVTLTGTSLRPGVQLVIEADGTEVGRVEPPAERDRSWQTDAIRWRPPGRVASFSLRLSGGGSDDWVLVRDIGLFSRAPPIPSALASSSPDGDAG